MSPKWLGGSLNFQFNGIIVCSGRSIPPFGTKMSGPAEPKAAKKESRNFASGSLQVLVSGATPISTLWFLNPWILAMGGIALYIGHWFREYEHSRGHCLSTIGYCHLGDAIGHPTILSSQLIQDVGEHGKTGEFHKRRPIATFYSL